MTDRKEVMSWLEGLTDEDWRRYHSDSEVQNIAKEAFELLKEQEAVMRTSRDRPNGFGFVWTCGACGSDLHPNNRQAKFCSHCGREVKWDA